MGKLTKKTQNREGFWEPKTRGSLDTDENRGFLGRNRDKKTKRKTGGEANKKRQKHREQNNSRRTGGRTKKNEKTDKKQGGRRHRPVVTFVFIFTHGCSR
ncbi:hypothetical protein NC652_038028 [Populus alba x Populus x berolinensis]|nr:hypothetical protein NC652_038028 [Populus alba x Populus x berolinensis]